MADSDKAIAAAQKLGFQEKIRFFCLKKATAAKSEPLTFTSETTGVALTVNEHDKRTAFADKVFENGYSLYNYTLSVLSNPTVLGSTTKEGENTSPDADLEFAVNERFSEFAGYDVAKDA